MSIFGISWGDLASGLATFGTDMVLGALAVPTGGLALAAVPFAGAAVGGLTGFLVDGGTTGEWSKAAESGIVDTVAGMAGAGLTGTLGRIGARAGLGFLTSEGAKYVGSSVIEGVANHFMDNAMPSSLPTRPAGRQYETAAVKAVPA
jgi:hypothetical protein